MRGGTEYHITSLAQPAQDECTRLKSENLLPAVEVTNVAAMLMEVGVDTDLREKRALVGL